MPNPLIGYDDLQYHNHDFDEDVDEEWFQGRDGWDQISLTKKQKRKKKKEKKKKKTVKSPRNVFRCTASIPQCHISSLSERCLNKITNADMPPPHLTPVRQPST